MNYKYFKDNIIYFTKSSIFKMLYIFTLIVVVSIAYADKSLFPSATYIQLYIMLVTNPAFVSFCIFLIPLVSAIFIYSKFEKNRSYIIRLKNMKKYLLTLLKQIISVNIFIFVIIHLTTMTVLNLFGHDFKIGILSDYNIPDLLYLIYTIVRIGILSQMFVIISVCLFKVMKPGIVLFGNAVIYGTLFASEYSIGLLQSYADMPLWIGKYIITDLYGSFMLEVNCVILVLIIMTIFILLLINIIPKFIKQVGD